MVTGIVNNDLEPVVEIELLLGRKKVNTRAVIDTGFNGYLSIPLRLIADSEWRFVGYEKYELATGEIVEEKVYLGYVIFNGEKFLVGALSSRTKDVLIGTRLLSESIVIIDFKRKHLTVEKT